MKFVIKKEDLYNGIKIVERATSVRALQPVLSRYYHQRPPEFLLLEFYSGCQQRVTHQIFPQGAAKSVP